MRFIGITGGVGSGKTEVLKYIGRHYLCEIYLADETAHLLQQPGQVCYRELVGLLGEGILRPDGQIDRGVMAERIFADEELLFRVNAIVHPRVRQFLAEKLEAARRKPEIELFFVEAALLIEAGYKEILDELWYIYAREDVRRDRLLAGRGYSGEKTAEIMRKQLPEEKFREACDFIVDNSGSLEETCRQIDKKLEAFTWRE